MAEGCCCFVWLKVVVCFVWLKAVVVLCGSRLLFCMAQGCCFVWLTVVVVLYG